MRSSVLLRRACLATALPLALGCPPPEATPETASDPTPAAVVGERTITLGELDQRIRDDLFTEATGDGDPAQLYELRDETLDEMIDEALIEAEAKAQGVEADELLEREAKPEPVEFADVQGFYDQIKGRMGPDVELEAVADQIRMRLESQNEAQARAAFLTSLREKADVRVEIEPPRIEVAAVGPALGPADAPVTIIEFSDYQCPFCQRAEPTLKQIAARYPEQVRIVYRHFPLDNIHPLARGASEAAACAGEQDKFWEYHALIWRETPELDADKLAALAQEAELDLEAFSSCVGEGRFADEIEADLEAGREAGVNGTPAFFVNGIPLSGAQPLDAFVELIESELARAGS